MHCSACFRDRRNTRAAPISMSSNVTRLLIPAYRHPILSVTTSSSRPECTSCTTKSPASIFYLNSIRNYTRYTHASIIFIVLYPSCTHTHHTPTHLRLSWSPRRGVSARFSRFPTSHIPFSSMIFLHAGTQETPPPHTFMTCIMDHSHFVLDFQRSLLYRVTFNLYSPFILRLVE
ncbi:hypothetical protein OG21DRAFT_1121870 [Imleria badia]|nr:hypothetical protein OG21DRAFT_1121870 [Imleria badia]